MGNTKALCMKSTIAEMHAIVLRNLHSTLQDCHQGTNTHTKPHDNQYKTILGLIRSESKGKRTMAEFGVDLPPKMLWLE